MSARRAQPKRARPKRARPKRARPKRARPKRARPKRAGPKPAGPRAPGTPDRPAPGGPGRQPDAVPILAVELAASAAGPDGFPGAALPEIAILGRSNVGKSSLLNRLVARRRLARTSSTPGKTRLVHFYRVARRAGPTLHLVDLPGYGYARVARSERARWRSLVEGYLERRARGRGAPLRGAVLLQDLRRDVTDDETDLVDWLGDRGVPVLVALTKADKLKPMRRAARAAALRRRLDLPDACVITTSAETGLGVAALWDAIDALL